MILSKLSSAPCEGNLSWVGRCGAAPKFDRSGTSPYCTICHVTCSQNTTFACFEPLFD